VTPEGSSSLPDYGTHPTGRRRKAIPATCQLHRSPIGFANLMVSKHDDGTIVFAPHVTGSCVISLDEEGARKLCDLLTAWLR
jgi:hypothetical protein